MNKTDLKDFYRKGTKDELTYCSTQFNSIELNANFYSMPSPEQVLTWKDKRPADFKFFPKISNTVTHSRRLLNITDVVTAFASSVLNFDEKLGMVFLQLHDNFKRKDYDRLEIFVKDWPKEVPLAVELRNSEWFADEEIFNKTMDLFEKHNITNIIVDTAGRRDLYTCDSRPTRLLFGTSARTLTVITQDLMTGSNDSKSGRNKVCKICISLCIRMLKKYRRFYPLILLKK